MDIVKPINDSWNFIKANPSIALTAVLPALMLIILNVSVLGLPQDPLAYTNVTLWVFLPTLLAVYFVYFLVSVHASLWVVSSMVKKGKFSLKDTFTTSLKITPAAVAASIIFIMIAIGGMMLLILPGVYLMLRLMFFSQAIVIDKKGVVDSLKHSWNLTKGYWWNTFALILILGLIMFIISIPGTISSFAGVYGGLAQPGSLGVWTLFSILYSSVLMLFAIPFTTGAYTFYYIQLKKPRKK